jgi:hypothetical protein
LELVVESEVREDKEGGAGEMDMDVEDEMEIG